MAMLQLSSVRIQVRAEARGLASRPQGLHSPAAAPLVRSRAQRVAAARPKALRSARLPVAASTSSPPPRWEGDRPAPVDSDELIPDQADIVQKVKLTVEDLKKAGIAQGKINLWVLGSYSDTKGVALLQQVINDTVSENLPSDQLIKLQKMYNLLQDVLLDEIDYLEEDANRVQSVITDNLDLSEDEKKALASDMATASKLAIDNALWSSITLVLVGLTLFNFLRGN